MREPSELEVLNRRLSWLRGYAAAREDTNLLDCVQLVDDSVRTLLGPGPEPGLSNDDFSEWRLEAESTPEQPDPIPPKETTEGEGEAEAMVIVGNPAVGHEDNELTGERTYIYQDGTRSEPQPAPASWSRMGSDATSPNGSAETE